MSLTHQKRGIHRPHTSYNITNFNLVKIPVVNPWVYNDISMQIAIYNIRLRLEARLGATVLEMKFEED